MHERRASGLEYLELATELLHRVRLTDPEAGVWEAADLQWWWRTPRRSDTIEQLFWADDDGPVAALVLTEWQRGWGCDPIVVPGADGATLPSVWERGLEIVDELGLESVETLVRDDDAELRRLLAESDFVPDDDEEAGSTWMDARHAPKVVRPPDGFVLVDRAREAPGPHPMRKRNGDAVEDRLRQCSLYDPALDLAVEAADGRQAGYALFWFDPVTEVGLVEPMRVEDEFQRRGLARALLTEGVARVVGRGARRLKVGYGTEIARKLYTGAGFRVAVTETTYRRERPSVRV